MTRRRRRKCTPIARQGCGEIDDLSPGLFHGGIFGGYNTYDTSRRGLGGNATGDTDGAEWSTFVSAGRDFHFGNLTLGPAASLQYTNAYVTGFSETGSVAPLQIHSDSEESLRTDLGFKASYPWQIRAVMVAPSLKAAWEHEFKYSALLVMRDWPMFPGRRRLLSALLKAMIAQY